MPVSKTDINRRETLLAVCGAVLLLALSIAFWNSVFLAPVKLFVVLMHELSHGIAAVATGGEIVRIDIDPRIGGTCLTSGGIPFVVVSSGYLGSMLMGGCILLAAGRPRAVKALAWTIGLGALAVTLAFVRNAFGLAFGIVFGLLMVAAARFLRQPWLSGILLYLGGASCLYALVDVKEDLLTLETRVTDASIMDSMTGVPAIVWGVLWGALSLLLFLLVVRRAYRNMLAFR